MYPFFRFLLIEIKRGKTIIVFSLVYFFIFFFYSHKIDPNFIPVWGRASPAARYSSAKRLYCLNGSGEERRQRVCERSRRSKAVCKSEVQNQVLPGGFGNRRPTESVNDEWIVSVRVSPRLSKSGQVVEGNRETRWSWNGAIRSANRVAYEQLGSSNFDRFHWCELLVVFHTI